MECHYLLMPINKVVKFKINILLRATSECEVHSGEIYGWEN